MRKCLKLWHVNANSVDVMRLNILSSGLLDPIGTSRVKVFPLHTSANSASHPKDPFLPVSVRF